MENEWVMMDVQYQCYSLLEGRIWVPLLNTQVTRQTIFEDLQVQHQIPRCFLGKLPCMYIWLVVWNMFYFSNILGTIIPTGELIFFRGVGSTTNQISKICCWHVCWVLILSFCNLSQVTTADVFSLWQPTGDDELVSTISSWFQPLLLAGCIESTCRNLHYECIVCVFPGFYGYFAFLTSFHHIAWTYFLPCGFHMLQTVPLSSGYVNLTDQLNEMREELEEKIDEQVTWEFCCFRVWSFSDWNTNVENICL